MNKHLRFLTVAITLMIVATTLTPTRGQDPDWQPPGTEEAAAVDRANGEIDKVYKGLMDKLDSKKQKSLRDAQRAWIKWRDAEADFITRLGGSEGGSAFRVDYSNALLKLIKERTEVLREYSREADKND